MSRYISNRDSRVFVIFFLTLFFLPLFFVSKVNAASPSVTFSNEIYPNQPIQMRNMITTTDGTIHHFVQVGNYGVLCDGSTLSGLLWFTSSDGITWECEGQLSSDTTTKYYASSSVDVNNNIYVTYSSVLTGVNANYDIYFRKLTKGVGSTWTVETEQKVLDADATKGYTMSNISVEDSNRLWVTARYYNGTDYRIHVYYSDGQSASPVWTQALDAIDTPSTDNSTHISAILESDTHMIIIYNEYYGVYTGAVYMSTYLKGSAPNGWSEPIYVGFNLYYRQFSAVIDDDGYIYVAGSNDSGLMIAVLNENGRIGLGGEYTIPLQQYINTPYSGTLSTDGTDVWVSYFDVTSAYRYLPGRGKIRVDRVLAPGDSGNVYFVENPVSSQGFFNTYWYYNGSTYTDDIVDANDVGTNDTSGGSALGNIVYFGKNTKFEGISWAMSAVGSGGAVAWEYWNGTSWESLTIKLSQNPNLSVFSGFAYQGYLSFEEPSDWATTSIGLDVSEYYYIRYRITTAYSSAISGSQYSSNPPINGITSPSRIINDKMYLTWSEGSITTAEVRSRPVDVDTSSLSESNKSEITPAVLGYVDRYATMFEPYSRALLETIDGTLHFFSRVDTWTPVVCGSTRASGTLWFTSSDNGNTWECAGELSPLENPDINVIGDSNGNIYVTYFSSDIIYFQKLTKGAGSTWSISTPQQISVPEEDFYYMYQSLVVEDDDRIWVSFDYVDWLNDMHYVQVMYSDGLSDTPVWNMSVSQMNSEPSASNDNGTILVRFGGDKIGILYTNGDDKLYLRYRTDGDNLTSWSDPILVPATDIWGYNTEFSAVGTEDGKIFATWIDYNDDFMYFSWFNGTTWSDPINLNEEEYSGTQVSTDGVNVYITTYEEERLVIYSGEYPYTLTDFTDITTDVYGRSLNFDKVWTYVSGVYTDETSDALSITTLDVGPIVNIGDILYVGSTEKFDSLSWGLTASTGNGSVIWEYWNGSIWKQIKSLSGWNTSLRRNGALRSAKFTPYSDWEKISLNGEEISHYYIRARVVVNFSPGVTLNHINSLSTGSITMPSYLPEGEIQAVYSEGSSGIERVRYLSYGEGDGGDEEDTPVSVTDLSASVSALDVDTDLDVTSPSLLFKGSNRSINLFSGSGATKKLVANLTVDLTESRSWSGVNAQVDAVSKKSVVTGLSTAPGVSSTWTFFVPKGLRDNAVRICYGASQLSSISTLCSPGSTLSTDTLGVSTINFEGQDYWSIGGMAISGGISYEIPSSTTEEEIEEEDPTPIYTYNPSVGEYLETPLEEELIEEVVDDDIEDTVIEKLSDIEDEKKVEDEFTFFRDLLKNFSGSSIASASAMAVIVGSLIVVITIFSLQITSVGNPLYIYLFQLFSSLFGIGQIRKKGQSYGVVYDSVTKEPISRAIVRVLDSTHRLISTVVTDIYGIFDINIQSGRYRFNIDTNAYRFPSLVIQTERDEPYENIYRGSIINHNSNDILNVSIPLDKMDRGIFEESGATFKNVASGVWSLTGGLFFVLGFAVNIYSVINSPNIYVWFFLGIYILCILVYLYIYIQSKRGFGYVTDIQGNPLSGVEIGLLELEFDTLYSKRVTDEKGKYRFIIPEGSYRLILLESEYEIRGIEKREFEVKKGKIQIVKERVSISKSK